MQDRLKDIKLMLIKYKSLIRYVIVGFINTGVDFLFFSLFQSFFMLSLAPSQTAGYCAGIINSFLMNKFWTFEDKTAAKKTTVQAVKFAAVNIVSLGVSIYFLKFLNEVLGINVYISKGFITLLTLVVNFFGYKLFVFRQNN